MSKDLSITKIDQVVIDLSYELYQTIEMDFFL